MCSLSKKSKEEEEKKRKQLAISDTFPHGMVQSAVMMAPFWEVVSGFPATLMPARDQDPERRTVRVISARPIFVPGSFGRDK